jgi:hypothetical protein
MKIAKRESTRLLSQKVSKKESTRLVSQKVSKKESTRFTQLAFSDHFELAFYHLLREFL